MSFQDQTSDTPGRRALELCFKRHITSFMNTTCVFWEKGGGDSMKKKDLKGVAVEVLQAIKVVFSRVE